MLLSIIFINFLSVKVSAQGCEPGTVSLTCDQFRIEIEAATSPQDPCYSCMLGNINCHRIQYQVYLVATIPPSSQPISLCYTDLSITIGFSETSNPGNGFPFLSTLNKQSSIDCSAGYGFEQLIDIDDANKKVVMTTLGSGQHPPIILTRGHSNPLVECQPGVMRAQLFTIVVDAWIGELVTASCEELIFTRPESGIIDVNGDGYFTCDEDGTSDESPNPGSNTVLVCNGDQAAVSPMLNPQPNLTVDIGAVDISNLPDYGLIPISCNTTLSGFQYLDFMVRLTVDQLMTMPEIIAGDIQAVAGYPRIDKIPNATDPTMDDYLIYARYENVVLQLNANKFFDIKVNAPVFMSEGGTVCPAFQLGRLTTNTGCGAVQFSETNECIEFESLPVCDEKYSINVSGDPLFGIQTECKLQVLVGFNWAPSEDILSFHSLDLRLDFDVPDNVVLEDVDFSNALVCPASNNPAVCPGFTDCYKIIDNRTLSICFKQGAPGQYLTINRNNAYIILTFDAPANCISDVTLRQAEFGRVTFDPVTGAPTALPVCRLETPDPNDPNDQNFVKLNFPLCVPFLNSVIENKKTTPEPIEEVEVSITNGPCDYNFLSDCDGYSACLCNYGDYLVTPFKDDNPLNGVTTYDLVLISKHILGIEQLDSPYKMVAANSDVNDDAITTFDIVEIRKLILGIYDVLPQSPSWRFVDKDFMFPNPNNPFQTAFPESKTVTITSSAAGEANFIGMKIGDVNLTHIANGGCRPAAKSSRLRTFALGLTAPAAKSGDIVSVALRNSGPEALAALQAGLRFDTDALELLGISIGEVSGFSPDCMGLSRQGEGELRIVWLSPDFGENLWAPGQALCHFTFRAKQDRNSSVPILVTDNAVLSNEVYTPDNQTFEVALQSSRAAQRDDTAKPMPLLEASCVPNPTTGETSMVIESAQIGKARVFLFNAFGARVGYHELTLSRGRNQIALPESAAWPAGVYSWLVMLGTERVSEGRLVKQ